MRSGVSVVGLVCVLVGGSAFRDLLAHDPPQALRARIHTVAGHPVVATRAFLPGAHQPFVGQHLEVPAHGRLRQLEHRAQLGDCALMALENEQQPAPGGVGQCRHSVEYREV